MKTILVPIDGSEFSQRAMMKAKELADCMGSTILLLNIINVRSAVAYYNFSPRLAQDSVALDWKDIVATAREDANKLLEESKAALGDTKVETFVLDKPGANIYSVIVDFADEQDVDMIVMGSNGMGSRTRRMYMGSVTTRVLHSTSRPVLVVQ